MTPPASSPPGLAPNPFAAVRFGNYDLLEEIGRGAMGIVYRAQDRRVESIVALKVMRMQVGDGFVLAQRFRREAEILSQLDHPHIVPVHEIGQAEGHYFLGMRYMIDTKEARYV